MIHIPLQVLTQVLHNHKKELITNVIKRKKTKSEMNSRFLFSRVMLGLTAATSAFFVACSDIDTAQDPQKPTEGIMFSTSDVQDRPDASLPKTKAPEVYESHTINLTGANAKGFVLEESTVEGVNPVQQTPATRGTMKNAIDAQFTVFACKNGGVSPDYMYNEKVNANGTMVTPKKWKKSEASTLKFYAVYPAVQDADQQISPAAYSASQSPVIKFSPKSDVKQQADLMVAKTADMAYDNYVSTPVPLQFTHATTAIQFKIGNDLSYNQEVKKIEIQNVYGEGTYDLATKKWTLGTTKKSYTLTLSPTFSTAQNPGTVMNGGDGTFFMIPQTLPDEAKVKITFASGKYWEGKIGGSGKSWAEGTTKTYTISNSKDLSDRDFTLSITPTNGTERAYNQFDLPFTVTSYSHLKGYTGTDRDKAEPWQVASYEVSTDGTNWSAPTTTKPEMVTAMTESGNGGTSGEAGNLKLTNDYKDYAQIRNQELKAATEVTTRKDLSIINGRQYTANCYIVSAPGKYKFPLYYGNSRENSTDNTLSFQNNTSSANALKYFHGGIEQEPNNYMIPYPDIHQWVYGAKLLWESKTGLVKVTATNRNGHTQPHLGGRDIYVEFEVNKDNIETGNAIIAVTLNGKVAWSWHIWITGKEVADVQSGHFLSEPIGFVPTKWMRTTYRQDRYVKVTVKQPRSGKTASVVFKQKPHEETPEGQAMHYQWGRKDPLWPGMDGLRAQENGYNVGISLAESVQDPRLMGRPRHLEYVLGSTATNFGSTWDWNNNPAYTNSYLNLWDANNATGYNYTGTFVKTIYDPSPAGFHVPRTSQLSKVGNDKYVVSPKMGYLDPDYVADGALSPGIGYYWTSEKTFTNHDGTYAAFSVFGITDANSKIGVNGINNIVNPAMAYCVLPIKE